MFESSEDAYTQVKDMWAVLDRLDRLQRGLAERVAILESKTDAKVADKEVTITAEALEAAFDRAVDKWDIFNEHRGLVKALKRELGLA